MCRVFEVIEVWSKANVYEVWLSTAKHLLATKQYAQCGRMLTMLSIEVIALVLIAVSRANLEASWILGDCFLQPALNRATVGLRSMH